MFISVIYKASSFFLTSCLTENELNLLFFFNKTPYIFFHNQTQKKLYQETLKLRCLFHLKVNEKIKFEILGISRTTVEEDNNVNLDYYKKCWKCQ